MHSDICTPMQAMEHEQAARLGYCVVCWQEHHPNTDYPSQCERTLCAEHADYPLQARALRIARRSIHRQRTVNFVLVESDPQPERLWFPYRHHVNRPCYPANWSKISYVLRRSAGFRCEQCGSSCGVSVHHIGAPYADGGTGNPHDKHDCRRENLMALCKQCHEWIEQKTSRRFS